MKKTIFILIIGISSQIKGQIDSSLLKLIEETNYYFEEHQTYRPGFEMISLKKHQLTYGIIKEDGFDFDEGYSLGKDSLESLLFVDYFSMKISENLENILNHPSALGLDFLDFLNSDYCNSWLSPDGNFAQISYSSNTGGSYHSAETYLIYKTHKDSLSFSFLANNDSQGGNSNFKNFRSDGYSQVHEIKDSLRTKYLLLGGVKGCNTCYYEWATLVYFENNQFHFEFEQEVASRSYEQMISFNSEKKELKIYYPINDLTETCECQYAEDESDYVDLEAEAAVIPEGSFCYCLFRYTNTKFHLIEGRETNGEK